MGIVEGTRDVPGTSGPHRAIRSVRINHTRACRAVQDEARRHAIDIKTLTGSDGENVAATLREDCTEGTVHKGLTEGTVRVVEGVDDINGGLGRDRGCGG